MKNHLTRNILISAAVHIFIIGVLLAFSIASCRRRRAPREITTFVDLQLITPESKISPVVKPDEIPEPPVKKTKALPKKIKISKKLVKRTAPHESKKLSAKEIRKMLGKAALSRNRDTINSDFAFAWYLSLVRTAMYKAWHQPGALSGKKGLVTTVLIRVRRNGKIVQRKMIMSSGNTLMDTSVMDAVESVKRLQDLPPGFGNAYKDITIDFELSETRF